MSTKHDLRTERSRAAARAQHGDKDFPIWTKVERGLLIGWRPASNTWALRKWDGARYAAASLGTQPDYTAALRAARQLAGAMDEGADLALTVGGAVEKYATHRRQAGADDVASLKKHLTPALARTLLAKLKAGTLREWRAGLDVKPATRNRVFTILRAALNLAFQDGRASSDSAWRRLSALEVKERGEKFIPGREDVKKLLTQLDSDAPEFAQLARAGCLCGFRYGALASLTVEDFDAKGLTVHVRKDKTGPRTALLSSEAAAHFARCARGKHPKAWLYTEGGEPFRKNQQYHRMHEATRAAGLPEKLVFMSLRHYFISQSLLAGVPVNLVAANCGTSPQIIQKHYFKFMNDSGARQLLDRVALSA